MNRRERKLISIRETNLVRLGRLRHPRRIPPIHRKDDVEVQFVIDNRVAEHIESEIVRGRILLDILRKRYGVKVDTSNLR